MDKDFKPKGYPSVAPYLVVREPKRMMELLADVFGATQERKYHGEDGSVLHVELRIDDAVVMIGRASKSYPPNQLLIHVYVQDVDAVFEKALQAGCESLQSPKESKGDPDRRGGFRDHVGNRWFVATQVN